MTTRVSVTLERELLRRADEAARQDKQTRGEFLRQAVRRYVEEREALLWLEKEAAELPKLLASLPSLDELAEKLGEFPTIEPLEV